ncbi:MAG TPA: mechanosensitive ion channel domain-containing protein [Terriglobia bacterium]|nr:mechanosensitive ion channel domain-containing protein [Terriglobia bacterium]
MALFLAHWQAWLWSAAALLLTTGLALVAHRLFFAFFKRLAARTGSVIHHSLAEHGRRPAKWIVPLLAIVLVIPLLPLRAVFLEPVEHLAGIILIGAVGWAVIVVADVLADVAVARYRVDVADNLAARRIHTQIQVLRRVFIVVVVILTLGIMLMTVPSIRQLGTSLLASAGLAGLVVGMAMKPTLSSLIAGLQIAVTEPIRIDDVVIVQGEWGWIEEISTTYVVVRIWDLRRLVVPLSYFIEHPFQNWTRRTADLLGTVFVYVDYTVPVDEIRGELRTILESSELWDGNVCGLQVTDATERTVQLRALMSASDSSKAWDLRCYVREKLIAFLQERYPESLPRARAEIYGLPGNVGEPIPAPRHGSSAHS